MATVVCLPESIADIERLLQLLAAKQRVAMKNAAASCIKAAAQRSNDSLEWVAARTMPPGDEQCSRHSVPEPGSFDSTSTLAGVLS